MFHNHNDACNLLQIWELADWQKKGCLDKTGAFIAFKLVAACQQGYPPTWQSLQLALGPPSFASRSATPSIPNFGATSPSIEAEQWAINPAEQTKYESIFNGLNPVGGKVPGDKVQLVFRWKNTMKEKSDAALSLKCKLFQFCKKRDSISAKEISFCTFYPIFYFLIYDLTGANFQLA